MKRPPEPIPATGDAYAGGFAWTIDGSPLRGSVLSGSQFSGSDAGEPSLGMPLGSNTDTGSSL